MLLLVTTDYFTNGEHYMALHRWPTLVYHEALMAQEHFTFHTYCNQRLFLAVRANGSLLISIWTNGSQQLKDKFMIWQSSDVFVRLQCSCGSASWTVQLLAFAINVSFVLCRQVLNTGFAE
jgi:hypothetical protein